MESFAKGENDFDAGRYWRDRHWKLSGLGATGTLGAPLSWQRWLYRGKLRAYLRAFLASGISVRGRRVLDFGCGTGYFEDVWESLGARHTAGIDLVEDVIKALQARYPHRTYIAGDLARDPGLAARLESFDLVTAIDVLYHIIDDAELELVVATLANSIGKNGFMLITDALTDCQPAQHVKFRGRRTWEELLGRHGVAILHCEPVFVLQNRPNTLARLAPGISGALAYWADAALVRLSPGRANNFAIVCRRMGESSLAQTAPIRPA